MLHDPAADLRCECRANAARVDVSLQEQSGREIARLPVRGWLPASGRKPRDHPLDRGVEVRRGSAPQEALARATEEPDGGGGVGGAGGEDDRKERIAREECALRKGMEAGER